MRRGINVKEQSRMKNDDVEEREKGKCIQKKDSEVYWHRGRHREQQAALLSAYVSPAQLLSLFLLDSVSSVQLSSVQTLLWMLQCIAM